jgi:hypothetical protein
LLPRLMIDFMGLNSSMSRSSSSNKRCDFITNQGRPSETEEDISSLQWTVVFPVTLKSVNQPVHRNNILHPFFQNSERRRCVIERFS